MEHSYAVLEFDKLKEELIPYVSIDTNHYKIMNMSPFKDINILNRELNILTDFIDFILYDGGFESAGMKNICVLTESTKLIGTYLEPEDLWDINFNLRIFRLFKNRLDDLNKYKYLKEKFKDIPILKGIEDTINKTIDNNKEIKDEASLDLRDIRFAKKTTSLNIKKKFDELFEDPQFSKAFQEKIITTRDGRSVVPIKIDFKGLLKGIEHDRSSSGQTVFIEPMSIVSLNNRMRELEAKEKEEIRKILLRLTDTIRNIRADVDSIGEGILYLDILNTKANFAIIKKCVIPDINSREILSLIDARHPFIPEHKIVPLTFEIGKTYNTLLITGPNTGGKTVALKTAGLLSLMALSGIPIPANEKTSIGFFTGGIFADIGDEQSIEQSLSSFSAHLKNIQEIFEKVTKSSLVLLDELGSGTDPIEGSAFAMAAIDYFKEKKCKAIITTHYSQVKAYGYNTEDIETASMEFDVNTLSPTYKLLIGIPGESNALTIAKRLGVAESVIARARNYISDDNKKVETMIKNIKDKSDEMDILKSKINFLKGEVEREKDEYDEKLRILEKEKNEIIKDAYEKSELMVKEIQAKANAIIEKIQRDENQKEDLKNIQKNLNLLRSSIIEEKAQNVVKKQKIEIKLDYKVGDRVFINSLSQFAVVLKINMSKEIAQVQAGILKLEVPFDDIRKIKEEKKKKYTPVAVIKTRVRNEIDIRGKMVDEAIFELENYLDRAVMNSYTEVYIIHGKGTGALREGILKYLKDCRYVKDFRIGGHGEGGLGCTVVTLK
ncbi:MAG: endonuclease MutS2 [Fusobacteriaceae bacterium]|jgi:DNA mismatch repair protein MutS2|nr:endonuclease MutS2 [Fusobacteriaceae bacterium]